MKESVLCFAVELKLSKRREEMGKAWEDLKPYLEKMTALQTALTLFEWDTETLAPREAAPYTAKIVGILSEDYFRIVTDGKVQELAEKAAKEGRLSEVEETVLRELSEETNRLICIPPEEYRAFAELTAESAGIWAEAKKEQDFDHFAPTLKKVLDYQKKFASYQAKEGQKLYDVMLNTYEKGFDTESLDRFFGILKKELIPFLKQLTERGREIDDSFLTGNYDPGKQEEAVRYLAEYVGFDFSRGVLGESVHPFTTSLHNHDVRVTTAYSEHVDDSLFSVIHECGHSLYELGIPDELTQTLAGQGASMGMHESQSRFYENIIGRSLAFWEPVYGKLQEIFPQELGQVTVNQFVDAVNKVRPGLIRTQADELTYSIHILIRYEIEKMLVEDNLPVEELPQVWADKYEEYLGVRPENVSEGVLQDIHWSQGSFGYFPSYALGNAFGAQIYHHMKGQMDFDGLLRQGNIAAITEYLRENIHKYGKLKSSRQILKDITGEDFNPQYYVDYLIEKYKKIYEISG